MPGCNAAPPKWISDYGKWRWVASHIAVTHTRAGMHLVS